MTSNIVGGPDPDAMGTRYPQAQSQSVAPSQYVAIAFRRWPILLAVPLLAIGLAYAYELRRVPRYTAQVLLQRQAKTSPLQSFAEERSEGFNSQAVLSQLEIIRSRAVIGDAVDSTGLRAGLPAHGSLRSELFNILVVGPAAPSMSYSIEKLSSDSVKVVADKQVVIQMRVGDTVAFNGLLIALKPLAAKQLPISLGIQERDIAIDALRSQIRPEQVRGTSLFRVTYKDRDPHLAANLLNALAHSYERNVARQSRQEATRRREFLSQELAEVADSLSAAKAALAGYQQASQTVDPKSEGEAISIALRQAESELKTLQFQEGLLQGLLSSIRSGESSDRGLQSTVSVARELVPAADELYRHLRDLESERNRLTAGRFGYTQQGRNVQALDSLIAVTRADLRGAAEDGLQLLRARRGSAEQTVRDLRSKVSGLPSRTTTFNTLQQRALAVQQTYDVLSGKQYEAQLAEAVEAGNVQVIDRARVPLSPDPSNLRRNAIFALIGGLFIAFGIVAVLEFMDTTIRTSEDATRATGLEIVGVIPDFSKLDRRSASGGLEAFRKLRTTLRFVRTSRPGIIAVTSSAPGEGKSITAANLAASIAHEGTKVLLIDADLHRPTTHSLFSIPRSPGLSDVLVGEAQVESALISFGQSLVVLPCGTSAPNPAELLASEEFVSLLHNLRERFQVVIVDTPPVLAVSDASIITPHVDGVLFVARAEQTDSIALGQAVEQLRKVNAELFGLVMNKVPVGRGGYGSYYGYYDYSSYSDASSDRAKGRLILGTAKAKRHLKASV